MWGLQQAWLLLEAGYCFPALHQGVLHRYLHLPRPGLYVTEGEEGGGREGGRERREGGREGGREREGGKEGERCEYELDITLNNT